MISILYVDDENTLLEVTKVYLERTGEFSVAICSSAKVAIGILEAGSFDAVVSDYQMPGMDGLMFLKYLRSEKNTIPFILFTGKGREEVAIEALNSGADFYLQKGGEPKSQFAELTNKIRQAVQRKQAEKALAASEEKYRDLVENINDVLFAANEMGIITYISPRINQLGYISDEVIGKPIAAFIAADDLFRVEARFEEIKNNDLHPFEFQMVDRSGKNRYVRTSSRPLFVDGRFTGIQGVLSDITTERTAEAKINASEQRYRNVFEAAGDAMLVVDSGSGAILDANLAATYIFGYTVEELSRMNHADLLAGPASSSQDTRSPVSATPLTYYRKKDGTRFPAGVLSSRYPQKKRTISIISLSDITVQKRAEEKMVAAQRLYAVLSQINQAIVRVKDLETLVAEICRISIDFGRFRMAWVGLLDRESRSFRPVAHAGYEEGYLSAIETRVSSDEKGRGPTGIALREGRYDVCNDIGTDPRMLPWREEALKRGYRSSAAFPFRLHGEVVGAYTIYATEKDFFNEAEIALLEKIAMDISFALGMLDEKARRTHAERALAGSEERAAFLAEVLELSSQPFGVGYPDGKFGIVNPAFCDLLGYTEPELRSLTWNGITSPGYREQETTALSELVETGIPLRYEKEYLRKDGTNVPVEMFVHRVVDTGGNLQYFYGFITDISERRRIQDAIRIQRDLAQRYLDLAGVMLTVLDPQGNITLINRKGCDILGYAEPELLGKNWLSTCLPERMREDVQNVFTQLMSGDTAPVEYHENPVLTKSGEERILAFHNTLLLDKNSRIAGILFSGEDVTIHKQMEDAVRVSEERFRNLIQNSSDMIRIIDRDGRIAYSSPSTLRITGYNPPDIIGKDPLDYVHPDDLERVKGALGEVFGRTNPGEPTEYRIRQADGTYIDVEATAMNLMDTPGIFGIVTTTRPIAERKSAEQALRESEERYRAIFEGSADAIFEMSDRFLDCNTNAEHLFGHSRDEILGMTPEFISPKEQPGGRASADLATEYIQQAHSGTTRVFSWIHCRKNGQTFPAQVSLIPARVRGEQRIIAIVHDRTAETRDEQQFRHLARFPEMDPEPMIEVSATGESIYANQACYTVLQKLRMPPQPAAFLPPDFPDLIREAGTTTPFTAYREVRIGTAIFGETLAYDAEEKTCRIFAHDITTRAFETSALEQANRKLNLLSGITRHDIKNKLTGVMGYIELARGSTRDPDMIEYLNRAELSATAVRQQIEFTKEYENLGVKTPVWQDLSSVIEGVLQKVERGAVVIQKDVHGLQVYADPMFSKVFCCLLENALTHGDTLTKIRIHGSATPAGFLLEVEDDGVGVPKDRKEKIFNKNVGKNEGFGLFLTREILSITGMTIEETGEPEKGARFEISIPSGKFHVK
jgi:PAS domain S-box-containing protein